MNRRTFIAALGSAATWPVVARAQQSAVPVVGVLSAVDESRPLITRVREGLAEHGYVEGRNVEILYRWAGGRYERLPELAADLVRRRVAVIIAAGGGTQSALAAKSKTETTPIVFAIAGDPIAIGLVASLNRPGGNITGTTFLARELDAKRLEFLHEMASAAKSIGFLVEPRSYAVQGETAEVEAVARALGVRLTIRSASTPDEIEAAVTTFREQQIGALLTTGAPLFAVQGDQLAALAARNSLPAIYHTRDTVEAGGLMSYGSNIPDAQRRAIAYAGRILKGEKPANLPVQQSTNVQLVINLKTAKALGLTIPLSLLGRADEVIE